jgi:cytochrome c biogenesis protein CcmG, thiol:disulfide interchange protein DsbE
MRPWQRKLALLGAVAAFTTALLLILAAGLPQRADFTGQGQVDSIPIAPEINAIAPAFALYNADNTLVPLEQLRGHPVIVNFWATWCEPCRVEMPILQSIYDANSDVRILAVNLGEPVSLIREWQNALGLTYDMLVDERQSVATLYAIRGQPSTYVVSPSGIITDVFYGPVSHDALLAALK